MSTTLKFSILYLIPILSFAATIGIYLLAYGKSLHNPIIDFGLILVISCFISSSYLAVVLISHFLAQEVKYLGILFSVFAWILGIIPVWVYFVMFKESLNL